MTRRLEQLCLLVVVIATLTPTAAFAKIEETRLGNLPLYFEQNEGQTDARVRYLARGAGYTVFLTPQDATLLLRDSKEAGAAVRMKMLGASGTAQIAGSDRQASTSNYLRGSDPSAWRRDVPHFGKVRYSGVYPGIDVVFYGNEQRLEYDFIVAPGASPRPIALAFEGVEKMSLDAAGDLLLNVAGGRVLRQHAPFVYQETANGRRKIDASYALRGSRVEFRLGRYDRSKPLVIDPVLSYSTYHGGGYYDSGNAVAVDANGYAYITGQASATFNFPITPGAVDTTPDTYGYSDAFLAKFDPRGQLVYSTILGSDGPDVGFGVAADAAGNAYVAAELSSLDPPLTPGSFRTVASGADAYVVKINPQGNSVVYGVRVGGIYDDRTYGIALDRDGQAVVTGVTNGSQDFYTVNAAQPTYGGGYTDAFVFKVNATGSALVYSTFLGGGTDVLNNNRRTDEGKAIAVDAAGNAYVTGFTSSDDFPTTPGALDRLGDMDPFVTKYSPAGQIVYSARFGGDARDIGHGIAVDPNGNAYVAGETDAIYPYPTTPGAFRETGTFDAFVTKLNPTGTAMVYSTLLGGVAIEGSGSDNGADAARAIAVDAFGQAHVTGYTRSRNFPVANALYPTHTGGGLYFDVFVTKFNAAGSGLLFSTYLGGNGNEEGKGIAVDANGGIYVVGLTSSTTFPTTAGAPQRVNASDDGNGSAHDDAFLTKISEPRSSAPARPLFMSADFGGDGNSEILWKHGKTGQLAMWELSGRTLLNGWVFTTTDLAWEIQGFGDFNGDGKADIVLRNRSTNQIATWLMNGRTILSSKTVVTLSSASWELHAIGNFNSDNRSEIIWRHMTTGQLAMWELNGHTLINGNVFTTLADRDWELLTSGDFNADGRTELLWRHAISGELAMWDLNGRTVTNTGVFASMFDPAWKLAATGDFNGDRRTDLVWQSSTTGEVRLWEISGRTVLRAQKVYTVADFNWRLETSGDFNRDGRSELIWRHATTGDVAMWEMNGPMLLNGAVFYSVKDLSWVIQPARRPAVTTAAAASISSMSVEDDASASEPGFIRDGFVDAWPHPETSSETHRWSAEDPAKTPLWNPAEPPGHGGRARGNPRERR